MIRDSKIYDCVLFLNELDLLEIRINELKDIVDKFIIIESTETFANKPKDLIFSLNRDRFKDFEDKIYHYVITDMPKTGSRWDCEYYSFNKMSDAVHELNPDPNDIIIIAPVDEIPRATTLVENYDSYFEQACTLMQTFYYYFTNVECLSSGDPLCAGPPICTIECMDFYGGPQALMNLRPSDLKKIYNGGWHFSYTGGTKIIKEKFESFSHSEFDNEYFKNEERLKTKINNLEDIMDRHWHSYRKVELDDSFPNFLLKNRKKFSHLILE